VKRGRTPRKLGMLARGAQSEELRQRRQSGVVDINSGRTLATLVKGWDMAKIHRTPQVSAK
jgi:hypothetical protein